MKLGRGLVGGILGEQKERTREQIGSYVIVTVYEILKIEENSNKNKFKKEKMYKWCGWCGYVMLLLQLECDLSLTGSCE